MVWVFVGVAVLVIGLTVALASGRLGAMPEAIVDRPVPRLPDGELSATDVRDASFAVVMRGYSMEQVDALLSRLADQLDAESPEDVVADSESQPAGEGDLPRSPTDVTAPADVPAAAAGYSAGEADAETASL
ncbi:MAG TPA: DivIVA domain-containing protein [Propionibacteriaceae bacterium]|nr:DivIVA domain-containing protein [Propionibacteriaceae bacterium]